MPYLVPKETKTLSICACNSLADQAATTSGRSAEAPRLSEDSHHPFRSLIANIARSAAVAAVAFALVRLPLFFKSAEDKRVESQTPIIRTL
jgi:hypothetical protein